MGSGPPSPSKWLVRAAANDAPADEDANTEQVLQSDDLLEPTEILTPQVPSLATSPHALDSADPDAMVGEVLGRYRILKCIGTGGMGRVYLAEHVKLGRRVALKLLRPEFTADRDAVQRFFREARAVNKIGHENIVDVTDLVVLENRTFFIMELLQGKTLQKVLEEADGPLTLYQAMHIVMQVCDALEAAHDMGVVHRDLKPDNIFIVNHGARRDFVKLLDFGVAKLMGGAHGYSSFQTAAGAMVGTPAYMSPEQAMSLPLDHRSDIYSLGAILYQMLTGWLVFQARSAAEFVVMHAREEPVPPRDLPDAPELPPLLEEVLLRCLAKSPDERYQTVEELREALILSTATVATIIKRNPLPERRGPFPRGRWWLFAWAGSAAALLILAIWTVVVWRSPGESVVGQGPVDASHQATSATLTLFSIPSHAAVFRKDRSDVVLGRTPLDLELNNLGEEVELVFRLAGYESSTRTVMVAQQTVVVTLVPLPRPATQPTIAPRLAQQPAVRPARRRARRQRTTAGPRVKPIGHRLDGPRVKSDAGGRPTEVNPDDLVEPFDRR